LPWLFRNRNLNHVWLRALRTIAARAKTDPDYAHRVGCVLSGLTPAAGTLGTGTAAMIFGQALVPSPASASWHRLGRRGHPVRLTPGGIGDSAGYSMSPGEFKDWAAGTGWALAEFTIQLTRATINRSPRQQVLCQRVCGQITDDLAQRPAITRVGECHKEGHGNQRHSCWSQGVHAGWRWRE